MKSAMGPVSEFFAKGGKDYALLLGLMDGLASSMEAIQSKRTGMQPELD